MLTDCGPTSSRLPPPCLGFYTYAGSNLLHYVQATHSLDVSFVDPKFASQASLKRLRRALQVQCDIIISPLDLSPVHTTSHVSLSIPREALVIF